MHALTMEDLTGHEYDLLALKFKGDPLSVLDANRRRGLAGLQWIAARREHGPEAKWAEFDSMSLVEVMRLRAAAEGIDLDALDEDEDDEDDEDAPTSYEAAAEAAHEVIGEPVDPTPAAL